jgi:hypothetical protein
LGVVNALPTALVETRNDTPQLEAYSLGHSALQ